MSFWSNTLAAAASAIAASMGLGGGGVLIVWLAIVGVESFKARGINLLFFIPCAAVALFIHRKNGLIDLKKIVLPALFGLIGTVAGVALAGALQQRWATKLFGLFLALVGAGELLGAIRKKEK
ncbi:MAG: sulfite exporter TauE/SafE family protein [Clostridia bacterium]|nr:sulfite exporter TauE/SafE family protein [Clostridia bacterium]